MDKKGMIKLITLLFIIYCLILLILIIFKYPRVLIKEILVSWNFGLVYRNIRTANLIPFRTITRDIFTFDSYYIKVLMYNIIAFVPMGFLLPIISNKGKNIYFITIFATIFSLIIEVIQLITVLGAFDIDDILLNTIGAIIGFTLYLAFLKISNIVFK